MANIFRRLMQRRYLVGLLVGIGLLSYFLQESDRVFSEPIIAWESEPKADCGVVLTGGAGREREGFDLLARHAIQRLIISGVHPATSLRDMLPQWPFYGDLREEDIFLDRRSGTTYGNAQQTLPIVEALHCRDVVLVTSSLHMFRAYKTFRATFPEKISIYKHSIIPSRSEAGFWESSYEVLKTLFYSLWVY
jgi:uncharacterized SAM-binding protein YcdF (DUF218 family)